jgi:hypothetical protein
MPETLSPETVVRTFLSALEQRDTAAAGRFLATDAKIVFPGGVSRRSVDEIVAGSAAKYQKVGKTIERIDVLPDEDGTSIAYCFGTLHGRWVDGTPFEGIRFIDRFEMRDGKIVRHDVWNDGAYHRPPVAVTTR